MTCHIDWVEKLSQPWELQLRLLPSHSHLGRVFPHPLSAADDVTNGHQSQFTDTELGLAWKCIYRKLPSNKNLHSETTFTGLVLIRGSETSLDCLHPLFSHLVHCMCARTRFLARTQKSSLLLSIWEFGLKSKCVPWNCLKLPTVGVEIEGASRTDTVFLLLFN